MSPVENASAQVPSASEYILDNFEQSDRIAMLVLNRDVGETIQRITSAQKASSPDIRHVYLDLDHGGPEALKSVESSSAVPKPNYILTSSPGKFQIAWKVEEMTLDEAEGLLHALAREFGGDPAATDATRVLRLPGFANKKYGADFYVEVRRESTETYHLRDFKLHIDSQDSPRRNYNARTKREPSPRTGLSQSEHDWAFAKRALSRGEEPEEVIQQIAQHRAGDKSDPEDYARRTVTKAQAELDSKRQESEPPGERGIQERDA